MEKHGRMAYSVCFPIKLVPKHVPDRKFVAFTAASGVNLVGVCGEEI